MRVHQLVARLDSGDAISNHALAIHELLEEWGLESRIFAYDMDDYGRRFASFDSAYSDFMGSEEDLLIFHYGLYCDNYRIYLESRNRKVLIYHNITPPRFYEGLYPEAVRLCHLGADILPQLKEVDLALGVSEFNRRELVEAGFPEEKTGVLPINPTVDKLDAVDEDRDFLRWLGGGTTNILYVGRVVPNKRFEDVIKFFYCYHRAINARSRLIFVGPIPANEYYTALLSLVKKMDLEDRVYFLGKVSDSVLKSCYLGCHYYVSMSEHEGFCIPLLEAFYFGLPVLAYSAAAVPETMGGVGTLFTGKDYPLLAEMVDRMERDHGLKRRVLEAQRGRLEEFGADRFARKLRAVVDMFLKEKQGSGVG